MREFTLIPVTTNDKKAKKNSWTLSEFCSSEHSGTHIDAPLHYNREGWSLDAIPTHRLWRRPGIMVDVSEEVRTSMNPNFEIQPKHLTEFEIKFGSIPDGAVVLIRTGQGSKVRNITAYSGLDRNHKMNHPGISKNAAEWITTHTNNNNPPTHNHTHEGIVGVGIDTLSLDKGSTLHYPAHAVLFNRNIYGLENLANLEKLPPTGFYITILPLNIHQGSGAPARVVAETGDTIALHSAAVPTCTLTHTVELGEFCSSEHSGTHLDAPSHYAYNKWTVEKIPLDRLWRVPGHVNHILTSADLESWEEEHGVIPDGAVVFVRTGWGDKVGNIQDYSGVDESGKNNFPDQVNRISTPSEPSL
ncbi:hypothetical protein Pmani_040024 [Petrolisthes manimaculis]|uniref:Cyclase n=1 Tax=Petrolisthes manimaculis TaxID=1843537 RepID=A0AAE1ND01_9EUCA|nr:hypothetical protein Pmani_040024 [Petrolisthes manimaculis]